jgi:hypothetical protein
MRVSPYPPSSAAMAVAMLAGLAGGMAGSAGLGAGSAALGERRARTGRVGRAGAGDAEVTGDVAEGRADEHRGALRRDDVQVAVGAQVLVGV